MTINGQSDNEYADHPTPPQRRSQERNSMINKFIFSVCASVQLQGYDVLRLMYVDKEVATYTLAGFSEHPITIQDYRSYGLGALNLLLQDGRSRDFRARFNRPSNVLLFTGNNKDVLIQLMETMETDPL